MVPPLRTTRVRGVADGARARVSVRCRKVRRAAEKAVRYIPGVKGVINLITIKPKVEAEEIKKQIKGKIEEALKRMAAIDAESIQVDVQGSEIVLRGTVRSWAERHEAEKAAWSAPGVTSVKNYITVRAAA